MGLAKEALLRAFLQPTGKPARATCCSSNPSSSATLSVQQACMYVSLKTLFSMLSSDQNGQAAALRCAALGRAAALAAASCRSFAASRQAAASSGDMARRRAEAVAAASRRSFSTLRQTAASISDTPVTAPMTRALRVLPLRRRHASAAAICRAVYSSWALICAASCSVAAGIQ